MDILRPVGGGVGAVGGIGVVVARGDEHRTAHGSQRGLQPFQGFREYPLPVEQAAAGSSNSCIELTLPELETYAETTRWVDVCKPREG